MELTENSMVTICAQMACEANRLLCETLGDKSQPTWADIPELQRKDVIDAVKIVLAGASPEQQHAAWCASKVADGWTYGVTDETKKTHEWLVPWDQLSDLKKARRSLFSDVVSSTHVALVTVHRYMYTAYYDRSDQEPCKDSSEE